MKVPEKIGNLRHNRKIYLFLAAAFIHAFLILVVSPVIAEHPHFNQDIEAIESLIPIGQYHLNFKSIKGGDLTILLEAGGGMDSTEWSGLAPDLALKTGATVVSYDRAGFVKSDFPENKHDMKEVVKISLGAKVENTKS